MKSSCILLPFTQDIHRGALAYAVQFANKQQAALLPLALLPLTEQQWSKGPRLEAIEQANDFLEAVKYQAARAGVPIEPYEMRTQNVARSISLFAQEMLCEGILLFSQDEATVLLPSEVVKCLLEQATCKLYLVHLLPPSRDSLMQTLLRRCSNQIRRGLALQEKAQQPQEFPVPSGEMITISNRQIMTHTE